jgi:hypothetical protein
MDEPVFIHVGFANTGTTSLQRNFFGRRDEIFLAGEPYGERGGIFTAIKTVEDFNFDLGYFAALCHRLISAKSQGRTIVISDETLCEAPQLYISPHVMPRDVIALRLHRLFPSAKIIFTIRDQRQYVVSMYLNLKRNSAKFDQMPVPPFSHWLARQLTQPRSHFLQNLNYFETIELYEDLFGHDNICLLPIELLTIEGPERYLDRLCRFMDLDRDGRDVSNYAIIHNRRMSVRQELVAELLPQHRFAELLAELDKGIGDTRLDAVLDDGPRASVELSAQDEQKIGQRVKIGNWLLARDFGLDLKRWGYLLPDQALSPKQLDLAAQALRYRRVIAGLRRAEQSADAIELRRTAEVVALRSRLQQVAAELDTVGASPIWRTVRRIDGVRRSLSRAAAVLLSLSLT